MERGRQAGARAVARSSSNRSRSIQVCVYIIPLGNVDDNDDDNDDEYDDNDHGSENSHARKIVFRVYFHRLHLFLLGLPFTKDAAFERRWATRSITRSSAVVRLRGRDQSIARPTVTSVIPIAQRSRLCALAVERSLSLRWLAREKERKRLR